MGEQEGVMGVFGEVVEGVWVWGDMGGLCKNISGGIWGWQGEFRRGMGV